MKNPFCSLAMYSLQSLRSLALPLLTCVALIPYESAKAVPASPEPFEVTQPDGAKFRLHLRGDEYFSWHETADGYTVMKDRDGYWKFARAVAGRAEIEVVPNARAGVANPARLGLKKHALPEAGVLRAHVLKARQELEGQTEIAVTNSGTGGAAKSGGGTIHPNVVVSGTKGIKNVVILACFSNHWDDVNNTVLPAYGIVDTNQFWRLFNQAGYSDDGAVGSVRDYYREVSYGKLTVDSIITMWVRLPREESYYGGNSATSHGTNTSQMAVDAINAAAAAGVDFSQADTDGDGWVDCLDVIHSGYDEAAGASTNAVWSIKGGMPSVMTVNGVKMLNYHTESALRGNSGTGITRIGTPCHESGHFFGLPDLYDTSYLTDGLGNWCVMSGGVWQDGGARPVHFSAWCKAFLGFAKPFQVHSLTGVSLPRIEDNAVMGMVRDGMTNGEYYLVENRAKTGFDNGGQIYPGLLIYHIYNNSPGNKSTADPHPLVRLEEADGNDSVANGGAAHQTDTWSSTNGLAGGFSDLTDNTNTSAMAYQAGAYYLRTNDATSYSHITLKNFSAIGDPMTFDANTLKATITNQAVPAPDYTVSWTACSAATKYEVQEGAPVTLTNFFDGAEDEDAMYGNWYLCGKVQRVITNASYGGSACNYYLTGIQSMVLQKPFTVLPNTAISYYVISRIVAGNGSIKCEISNDGGNTWRTLVSDSGNISWSPRLINNAALAAAGIANGDQCLIRFACDIEYNSSYGGYGVYGFALDNINIANTQISANGNWTSLSANVTATSYNITGKSNGTNVYRVQAYANGAWQNFGSEGQTVVNLQPVATITAPANGATFTEPATVNLIATVATNNTTVGNVRLYNGTSLLATFTAPPFAYTLSDVEAGTYTITAQVDYNGSLISTSSPVYVTVNYQSPTVVNDIATATPSTALTIPVLANDTDPYGALGVASITQPGRGTAAIAGPNVIYTPALVTYGVDAFTYTATNINGRSATATVAVTTPFPNFTSAYTNAVLSYGPVAYWRLNESAGATAVDLLGAHNGTNNAGLVFATNGPGTATFAGFDLANTAYYFPSNTSVAIPALNLNTNAVTIAAWIKRSGSQADGAAIFACRAGGANMEMGLTSANAPRISWNGFVYTSGYSSLVVPDNTWTFMVLAVSSNQFRVYMATNATLFGGTNSDVNPAGGFAGISYIGWDPNSSARRFNGAIDEVAIYNQSLSQVQIAGLLQAAQTAQPAVALTSPANGGSFNAASNITLTAAVTTNGNHTIEKVRFYADATLLGEALTPPYTYSWSGVTAGSYAVVARLAYDGSGTVDSAAASISVTNANQPPVAGNMVMGAVMNQTATLAVGKILAHATDPENDALSVTAVSGNSTNGGVATLAFGNISYTPVTGFVGADQFSYTLSDSAGNSVTGIVTVMVANGESFNLLSARALLGGNSELKFNGIPYDAYALDWTHSLSAPITWLSLMTNAADGTGLIIYTNTPSGSNDFYRTRYVP